LPRRKRKERPLWGSTGRKSFLPNIMALPKRRKHPRAVQGAGEKARLRTIKDLDEAAGRLGQVCGLLLDPSVPDSALREAVFAVIKREDLEAAVRQNPGLIPQRTLVK
jgi:hypothetical protein